MATQIFSMNDFRATERIFSSFVKNHRFCLFGSKSKLSTLLNILFAACLISYSYLELSLFELAVFYRIVFMDLYFTQILHIYFYVQAYIFRPVKGVIVSGVVTDRNSSHVGQNFEFSKSIYFRRCINNGPTLSCCSSLQMLEKVVSLQKQTIKSKLSCKL